MLFRSWLSRLEKELNRQRQTLKPLKTLGFSVCLYYTVRAHLRHPGPTKRGGCENGVRDAGPLLRRIHPGHLRPYHQRSTETGSADDGERAGGDNPDLIVA